MDSELVQAYNEAFNAAGGHFRDDASGIDVYIRNDSTARRTVIVPWGSTEGADWRTNFSFLLKRWAKHPLAREDSKIRVHGGYVTGWMRIRDAVLSAVGYEDVLVTGYSMGAGMAEIIAVDVACNRPNARLHCVSFDGPKVWNRAGAASFARRVPMSTRVMYGNDVVAKVPPFYWGGAIQRHVGPERRWWRLSIRDHIAVQDGSVMLPLLEGGPA